MEEKREIKKCDTLKTVFLKKTLIFQISDGKRDSWVTFTIFEFIKVVGRYLVVDFYEHWSQRFSDASEYELDANMKRKMNSINSRSNNPYSSSNVGAQSLNATHSKAREVGENMWNEWKK